MLSKMTKAIIILISLLVSGSVAVIIHYFKVEHYQLTGAIFCSLLFLIFVKVSEFITDESEEGF